jgi:hypothetical protein
MQYTCTILLAEEGCTESSIDWMYCTLFELFAVYTAKHLPFCLIPFIELIYTGTTLHYLKVLSREMVPAEIWFIHKRERFLEKSALPPSCEFPLKIPRHLRQLLAIRILIAKVAPLLLTWKLPDNLAVHSGNVKMPAKLKEKINVNCEHLNR